MPAHFISGGGTEAAEVYQNQAVFDVWEPSAQVVLSYDCFLLARLNQSFNVVFLSLLILAAAQVLCVKPASFSPCSAT